jgi:hypothetical protein
VGTAPSSMFGSTASFDGGGMGMGAEPATATTGAARRDGHGKSGSSTSPGISSSWARRAYRRPQERWKRRECRVCAVRVQAALRRRLQPKRPTAPGGVARTGIPLSFETIWASARPAVPTPVVSPIGCRTGPLAPTVLTIAPPNSLRQVRPPPHHREHQDSPTTITPGASETALSTEKNGP